MLKGHRWRRALIFLLSSCVFLCCLRGKGKGMSHRALEIKAKGQQYSISRLYVSRACVCVFAYVVLLLVQCGEPKIKGEYLVRRLWCWGERQTLREGNSQAFHRKQGINAKLCVHKEWETRIPGNSTRVSRVEEEGQVDAPIGIRALLTPLPHCFSPAFTEFHRKKETATRERVTTLIAMPTTSPSRNPQRRVPRIARCRGYRRKSPFSPSHCFTMHNHSAPT